VYFKTAAEYTDLARFFGFRADPKTNALTKNGPVADQIEVRLDGKQQYLLVLARRVATWLGGSGQRLLWVTEMGIWPSSENRHLYDRLRSSYHDHRSIAEAPGHLFEEHEQADLVTFLELTLRFGWGGFLFGSPTCHLTISHDEWMLIGCEGNSQAIVRDLDDLKLLYKRRNG
jgi:hypothetical protein